MHVMKSVYSFFSISILQFLFSMGVYALCAVGLGFGDASFNTQVGSSKFFQN